MTEDEDFFKKDWSAHNVAVLEDAMEALYSTVVFESVNAELRGDAIQAIEQMILNYGGSSAVQKITAAPFSARLRASSHETLRRFGAQIRKIFGSKHD